MSSNGIPLKKVLRKYTLPPVRISRKEAFSFGLARKLLAHYEGTPLHMDMRSVLDKIAESLEGDITIEPDWLSEHVGVMPEDCVRIDPEVWGQIAGFIERREEIRATYQTFDGRISEYMLRPYHLLAYHGNWYVFAWNAAKERIATFALSRFRHIESTGARFAPPKDFDPKTYARKPVRSGIRHVIIAPLGSGRKRVRVRTANGSDSLILIALLPIADPCGAESPGCSSPPVARLEIELRSPLQYPVELVGCRRAVAVPGVRVRVRQRQRVGRHIRPVAER